jgi:uncharacterized protein YoxC
MSTDILSNPTIIAAAIAAVSAISGALLSERIKRAVVRDDISAKAMQSQVQGWDKYTGHLLKRVSDLEDEMRRKDDDCDKKIDSLRTEMTRRDDECKARIYELESRVNARGVPPLG